MKNNRTAHTFTSAFLSFLLSFGGICCLVTAFHLDVSTLTLAISCAVCCVAGCTLFCFRRGGAIAVCILALLGGYLWQDGQLADQTLRLGYIISSIYNRAYGWGYLGDPLAAESVLLPLCVLSGLIGLLAAYGLTRRCYTALTVLLSLLPLGLCLVVTDTVPDTRSLFMLLLGLLLLLLTQSVRRRSESEGIRLTWLLSIPVALSLVLLFVAIPRSTYSEQDRIENIANTAMEAFNELPYIEISEEGDISLNFTREIPSQVDLQSIGPNTQFSIRVMEVTAETSGKLYLRGRDFDTYTGTEWTSSKNRSETFSIASLKQSYLYDAEPVSAGALSIRTFGRRSIQYVPYYPGESVGLIGGAAANSSDSNAYSYQWYTLPADFETLVEEKWDFLRSGSFGYITEGPIDPLLSSSSLFSSYYLVSSYATRMDRFLELPAATEDWAQAYLAEHLSITPEDSICTTANAIAGLVRASASYDLNTQRMPDNRTDFAKWFLEDSDTGYCVHYATATTVLLRAAGIAARYVEGYMTDAVAGKTVTVTEKDAHAWVEYYIDGTGWTVLESTASATADPETDIPARTTDEPEESSGSPESTTAAQEESTPAESSTAPAPVDRTQPDDQKSLKVSKPLIVTVLLAVLLFIQWPVRIRLRNIRQSTGSANDRALKKWKHAQRLAKLMRQPPPEDLLELALRAKFSQHTLTGEELAAFDRFCTDAANALRRKPWWLQLYYRLFWAAY